MRKKTTTITISKEAYQSLLTEKLAYSANKGKQLTWDEFFGELLAAYKFFSDTQYVSKTPHNRM